MLAVRLRGVSKLYKLYDSPKDRLKELLGLGRFHREFWALRDIDLEVLRGESVGVVGLNGAGKSTLLQIIAGVLSPTHGKVEVNGRVSALLELGVGFHPELTGRENIRMLSSLMGIEWSEELENRIIKFAEIGEFIDQPVKTYSSGMFVRLAFSLSVCVDPDILIVDEALSVGDYYFQKKSFDKILEFKEKGKTLIFCSHSLYHVSHLCSRVLWIDSGRIKMDGPPDEVIPVYRDWLERKSAETVERSENKNNGYRGWKLKIRLLDEKGRETRVFETGKGFTAEIEFVSPFEECHIGLIFSRNVSTVIYATSTQVDGLGPLEKKGKIRWSTDRLPLLPGGYELTAVMLDAEGNVVVGTEIAKFEVKSPGEKEKVYGFVRIDGRWLVHQLEK